MLKYTTFAWLRATQFRRTGFDTRPTMLRTVPGEGDHVRHGEFFASTVVRPLIASKRA